MALRFKSSDPQPVIKLEPRRRAATACMFNVIRALCECL